MRKADRTSKPRTNFKKISYEFFYNELTYFLQFLFSALKTKKRKKSRNIFDSGERVMRGVKEGKLMFQRMLK